MPTAMGMGTSDSTRCKVLSKQLSSHLLFLSDHCLFIYEPTKLTHTFGQHGVSKLEVI